MNIIDGILDYQHIHTVNAHFVEIMRYITQYLKDINMIKITNETDIIFGKNHCNIHGEKY